MSFVKVEMVAVECDACGARGPVCVQPETAETYATSYAANITRLHKPGRHACAECRKAIAKEEAKP